MARLACKANTNNDVASAYYRITPLDSNSNLVLPKGNWTKADTSGGDLTIFKIHREILLKGSQVATFYQNYNVDFYYSVQKPNNDPNSSSPYSISEGFTNWIGVNNPAQLLYTADKAFNCSDNKLIVTSLRIVPMTGPNFGKQIFKEPEDWSSNNYFLDIYDTVYKFATTKIPEIALGDKYYTDWSFILFDFVARNVETQTFNQFIDIKTNSSALPSPAPAGCINYIMQNSADIVDKIL